MEDPMPIRRYHEEDPEDPRNEIDFVDEIHEDNEEYINKFWMTNFDKVKYQSYMGAYIVLTIEFWLSFDL